MLSALLRYLRGYLRIRILGYSPERFLNLCSHNHIYLWDLTPREHAYELYISVKGFRKLKPILRKTKTKVMIVERRGLPFFLYKYRKRKMFFIGMAACAVSIYIMSLFIWNIDINGNMTRTDENILTYLESQDVVHGMRKNKVDCDRIVKDLRKEYDDIVWVSASVEGTRLIIQVKENTDKTYNENQDTDKTQPTDIVADKDGYITEIITRSGVPLVHEKDEVQAGDILVRGAVEVVNDAGDIVNYQYQTADADIYAQTVLDYENSLPLTYDEKIYTGGEMLQSYLKIGKYYIGLGTLKHNYEEWEEYSKETRLKIGASFYLPFSYGQKVIKQYDSEVKDYANDEVKEILTAKFTLFCEELEKKGVVILENNVKIYKEQGMAVARGTLTIVEEIGTSQAAEMIVIEDEEGTDIDGDTGDDN